MFIRIIRGSRLGRGVLASLLALAVAAPLFAAPAPEVKEAEDALRKAINAADLDAADRAIAKLRSIGGKDGVGALLDLAKRLPPGHETAYWRLVTGAATVRDEEGLKAVLDAILDNKAISRDIMFALGNNRSPSVATLVYGPILDKGNEEFRLMAADGICLVEHVDAVDVIIDAYKREEKKKGSEVGRRLLAGLKWLTGADCGDASAWDAWWKGTGRAAGVQGRARREESTGTVVDDIEGPRFEETESLQKISKDRILVFVAHCPKKDSKLCNYDDMAALLAQMKIPHTVVTKEDFEAGKVQLDKAMAILLTCTQNNEHCVCKTCVPGTTGAGNRMVQCTGCDKHDVVKHKLSGGAIKRIKAWVERGGYVFSEDWGLSDLLEPAWPKHLKQGRMMKERTVGVSPSRGRTSHPLLRGVFIDPNAKAGEAPGREGDGTVSREPDAPETPAAKIERNWKIDADSPYIDVVNKGAVTTLMESDQLAKEGFSAVAITFLPSAADSRIDTGATKAEKLVGGRVLHVLSHFGKQQTREDEFALQNLLLNFLMEANRRFGKKGA